MEEYTYALSRMLHKVKFLSENMSEFRVFLHLNQMAYQD